MVDTTKKIILDTNFLLIPAQFGVDVFTGLEELCDFKFELYLLDKSLKELKNIKETPRLSKDDINCVVPHPSTSFPRTPIIKWIEPH